MFNLRQKFLGISLVLTLAVSYYAQIDTTESSDGDIVEPIKKTVFIKAVTDVKERTHGQIKSLRAPWGITESEVNIFPVPNEKKVEDSFKINLPVLAQVPIASPEPTAPPLPFIYLGKMINETVVTVFVSHNGKNLALKGGETIEGLYEVKSVDSQRVLFEYTPLKLEQILLVRG